MVPFCLPISPISLHLLPSSRTVVLHAGVLSVSRLSPLWFRDSICLKRFPCGAVKRDGGGGEKKNLIRESCQLRAELGHRENTNGLKDPAVIWSAAMQYIALCQLHIGQCVLLNQTGKPQNNGIDENLLMETTFVICFCCKIVCNKIHQRQIKR